MRKIFYQWAAVGILSSIGWGVDVMPNNTSWIPSTILWGIAGVWFLATLIYLIKHRHDKGHDVKENIATPLESIKSDLITLNAYEKETATEMARESCPQDKAIMIHDDFVSNYGGNIVSVISSVIRDVVRKRSVDSLIEFFKKIGDILDSDDCGLEKSLEKNVGYKSTRVELAQKRMKLKTGKKRRRIIQRNIDRVLALSYGLSSSVVLRGVLTIILKESIYSPMRAMLESIETAMEKSLNAMLDDLENEWTVSSAEIKGLESLLPTLSLLEGLLERE